MFTFFNCSLFTTTLQTYRSIQYTNNCRPGRPRKAPGAPVKSRLQSCITTGGGGGQQFKDTKKTPALRADANPYATPDPARSRNNDPYPTSNPVCPITMITVRREDADLEGISPKDVAQHIARFTGLCGQ